MRKTLILALAALFIAALAPAAFAADMGSDVCANIKATIKSNADVAGSVNAGLKTSTPSYLVLKCAFEASEEAGGSNNRVIVTSALKNGKNQDLILSAAGDARPGGEPADREFVGRISKLIAEESSALGISATSEGVEAASSQGDTAISADILGRDQGGIFHPSLTVGTYFTDNVYKTKDGKKADTLLLISPGISITLPRTKSQLQDPKIDVRGSGVGDSAYTPETQGTYNLVLSYKADVEYYLHNTNENFVNHNANASASAMFSRLNAALFASYGLTHDSRSNGPVDLNDYSTTTGGLNLSYAISERLNAGASASHMITEYDDKANNGKDRGDTTIGLNAGYRLTDKMGLSFDYSTTEVKYDKTGSPDSAEQKAFAGVLWDITGKTTGSMKVGYGKKSFDAAGMDDLSSLLVNGLVNYNFTSATTINASVSRSFRESDYAGADAIVTSAAGMEIVNQLTGKITGIAGFNYFEDAYDGSITVDGATKERTDYNFNASVAGRYDINRFMSADAGYTYENRKSSFNSFEYHVNTLFVKLNVAL